MKHPASSLGLFLALIALPSWGATQGSRSIAKGPSC
jgi:hypothetical protein